MRKLYIPHRNLNLSIESNLSNTNKQEKLRYWRSIGRRRALLRSLVDQWEVTRTEQCLLRGNLRRLNPKDRPILNLVLSLHGGLLGQALCELFPQSHWPAWLPARGRAHFDWRLRSNQKLFMDWFSNQLVEYSNATDECNSMENDENRTVLACGWYREECRELMVSAGGQGLLDIYGGSLVLMLLEVYGSSHRIEVWRFPEVTPMTIWERADVQWDFMCHLRQELHIVHLKDWLKVKPEDLNRLGALPFLRYCYGGSLSLAIRCLVHSHQSSKVANSSKENRNRKMDCRELGDGNLGDLEAHSITYEKHTELFRRVQPDRYGDFFLDWYNVRISEADLRLRRLVNRDFGGSLVTALCSIYPDYQWVPWGFRKVPRGFWTDLIADLVS